MRRKRPVHMGTPRPAHISHTYTSVCGADSPESDRDCGRGIARARQGWRDAERRAHGRAYRSRIDEGAHAHDLGWYMWPIVFNSSTRMMSLGCGKVRNDLYAPASGEEL